MTAERNVMFRNFYMNLFLFDGEGAAEGGAEGGAAQAAGQLATDNTDGAETVPAEEGTGADLDAEFDELIRGKYKDQYNKRFQQGYERRTRGLHRAKSAYDKMTPVMDRVLARYGAKDVDDLSAKLDEDDDLVSVRAAEKGMSNEGYREYENVSARLAAYERAEQDRAKADQIAAWRQEGEEVRAAYPDFDIEAEFANDEFFDLINAGVPMMHAYRVVHLDNLIVGAAAQARREGAAQATESIRSNKQRPSENGTGRGSPGKAITEIRRLTSKQMDELERRAARGERITLT